MKSTITAIKAPIELAKTSLISAFRVVVKTPWHISITTPKKNENKNAFITANLFSFLYVDFQNKNHKKVIPKWKVRWPILSNLKTLTAGKLSALAKHK